MVPPHSLGCIISTEGRTTPIPSTSMPIMMRGEGPPTHVPARRGLPTRYHTQSDGSNMVGTGGRSGGVGAAAGSRSTGSGGAVGTMTLGVSGTAGTRPRRRLVASGRFVPAFAGIFGAAFAAAGAGADPEVPAPVPAAGAGADPEVPAPVPAPPGCGSDPRAPDPALGAALGEATPEEAATAIERGGVGAECVGSLSCRRRAAPLLGDGKNSYPEQCLVWTMFPLSSRSPRLQHWQQNPCQR